MKLPSTRTLVGYLFCHNHVKCTSENGPNKEVLVRIWPPRSPSSNRNLQGGAWKSGLPGSVNREVFVVVLFSSSNLVVFCFWKARSYYFFYKIHRSISLSRLLLITMSVSKILWRKHKAKTCRTPTFRKPHQKPIVSQQPPQPLNKNKATPSKPYVLFI